MSEDVGSRYLASYLKQREDEFLVYSHVDDCDFVDVDKLQKLIQKYYDSQM